MKDFIDGVKHVMKTNFPFTMSTVKKMRMYLYCLYFDFWDLQLSKLDLKRLEKKKKEKPFYNRVSKINMKKTLFSKFVKLNYFLSDTLWFYMCSFSYKTDKSEMSVFSSYFSAVSTDSGFYYNFNKFNKNTEFMKHIKQYMFYFFHYFWIGVSMWMTPLMMFLIICYFSLVLKSMPFNKVMFVWMSLLMFFYWLVSGFVFFFKKYQFGKYTSVVQSFWSRTYMLFWIMEGGTFLVFLFFTMNSSQESFYMFDQINILKTHLYSWSSFLLKLFPLMILMVFTYIFIMTVKWNIFNKSSIWLLTMTMFLSYMVWLEFYQFFHVLNFYGNLNWVYDIDDHSWSLEQEPSSTRIVNHYMMLLFMLKFWHMIFIYGFWIFFSLSSLETKSISYPLLSANFQNFMMLYIFSWVYMYPWFKFFFSKFLDTPYYWFYMNNRELAFSVVFNDVKMMYTGLLKYYNFYNLSFLNKFYSTPFYEMKMVSKNNNYESFSKNMMKSSMIQII